MLSRRVVVRVQVHLIIDFQIGKTTASYIPTHGPKSETMGDDSTATYSFRPRGILNSTGTACHLNAALVLAAHSLPPPSDSSLRNSYIALRDSSASTPYVADYSSIVPDQAASELGDAAEALRRLLRGTNSSALKGAWQTVLTCGSRSKVLPVKPIPNPYPLQVPEIMVGLAEALRTSWSNQQVIEGYCWDGESDTESGTQVPTKRQRQVLSLPSILLVHIQRFSFCVETKRLIASQSLLNIPAALSPSDFVDEDNGMPSIPQFSGYTLTSGILHVEDRSLPWYSRDDDGHYVALVLIRDQWFLIDDDKVQSVPVEQVLQWLQGDDFYEDDFARGILLVYDQSPSDTQHMWERVTPRDTATGQIT